MAVSDPMSNSEGMSRVAVAVLVGLVAVELVGIVILGGLMVMLGAGQTIAVGVGLVLVALLATVVAWRTARRV